MKLQEICNLLNQKTGFFLVWKVCYLTFLSVQGMEDLNKKIADFFPSTKPENIFEYLWQYYENLIHN